MFGFSNYDNADAPAFIHISLTSIADDFKVQVLILTYYNFQNLIRESGLTLLGELDVAIVGSTCAIVQNNYIVSKPSEISRTGKE